MKCARPKCTRSSNRQGLCHQHYEREPLRGYVDAAPVKARIELLLERGMGWRGIEDATGLSVAWLLKNPGRVQARTLQKVFAVPVPNGVVAGGFTSSLGVRRRIQALSAIGWSQGDTSEMLGRNRAFVNQLLSRDRVLSRTAEDVAGLYQRLCMTAGTSRQAKALAARRGWPPPLAWDDIDDPNEQPCVGEVRWVPFMERYAELEYLNIRMSERPSLLGIQAESLERALSRHGVAS